MCTADVLHNCNGVDVENIFVRSEYINEITKFKIPFCYALAEDFYSLWNDDCSIWIHTYVSRSFWTGCLEWELQMVQLSATRYSSITILWFSRVSFATINLCVASQHVLLLLLLISLLTQSGNFWIHPCTLGVNT